MPALFISKKRQNVIEDAFLFSISFEKIKACSRNKKPFNKLGGS